MSDMPGLNIIVASADGQRFYAALETAARSTKKIVLGRKAKGKRVLRLLGAGKLQA